MRCQPLKSRGRAKNGLHRWTAMALILACNLARYHDWGYYVEASVSQLAGDLAEAPWGGGWMRLLTDWVPIRPRPMIPKGAWLS